LARRHGLDPHAASDEFLSFSFDLVLSVVEPAFIRQIVRAAR
jgi:hypothetical protein